MLILITESHNKIFAKTEKKYFDGLIKELRNKELYLKPLKVVNVRAGLFKYKKTIGNHDNIFIVSDNENKNWDFNQKIISKCQSFNSKCKITNTINKTRLYNFEMFLKKHCPKGQSKNCDFGKNSGKSYNHKSQKNLFSWIAKKFHPEIMQKNKKHMINLIEHLASFNNGAHLIFKFIIKNKDFKNQKRS